MDKARVRHPAASEENLSSPFTAGGNPAGIRFITSFFVPVTPVTHLLFEKSQCENQSPTILLRMRAMG